MAFTPISNDFIQYQATASGTSAAAYFLKLYAAKTTTPISAALDSAGSVLVAKVELDSLGFAVNGSGGSTTVYIDQTYRLVLYVNSTDADNNTFANAIQDIDDIPQNATIATASENVKNFAILAGAVADTSLVDGDALNIAERTAGNAGGAMWDVVLSSTVTENTYNIVQCTGVGTLSLVLRLKSGVRYTTQFGAYNGLADSFGAINAAILSLPEGGEVYLPIGNINIGPNTIRDDLLTPTTVGRTITLIGYGSTEDQAGSGLVTTINTTGANNGIVFNGNRSGGRDFTIKGDNGAQDTAVANIVVESSRALWRNIVSLDSRGTGILFRFGNNSTFSHITCLGNNYRGFDADGTGYIFPNDSSSRPNDLNACNFMLIDTRANADIGFRTGVNSGFSNFYYNITTQGNGKAGLEVNGDFNRFFGFYGEANGGDTITAGSFVIGFQYVILTVGTTDYTLIGSADNDIGTAFIATGVGAGTGTATENMDILFSSTADNNFMWGVFSNSELLGATFHRDLSTNQRNYIDRFKSTSNLIQTQLVRLGENTSPAGHIDISGEGDATNPSITLEGTSGTQQIDITSSGAGELGINPDFIVLEASTAPTLLNSWVNFGGSRKVAGYFKDAYGIVHLEGVIASGTTTSSTPLFVLATGYRPTAREYFSTTSGGAFASGFIDADGTVYIESGANTSFALSSINFRVS